MGANATVGTFIAVVVAHIMVDFMGMSVWPVYKTLAGLDVAKAGWIATVIGMSGTALQPLFGLIADRFGPRRVILLGALLTSFASLLGPLVDYQSALDRRLPTLFGLSGFYLVVFVILAAGRLGQDMFHPSGAGLAGSFSARRGSMFLAVFIAVGSIGFGLSQIVFRTAYNNLGHHTEILLIPAAILWAFVWLRCRPAEVPYSERISVIGSLHALRPVAGQILVLFLILAISSGVMSGLFFLMPEFAHEKGYPAWIGQGGAFGLLIFGAMVFMVPMGHLADRIGRRRTLIAMMILSAISYHAIVQLTLPVPAFILLCIVGGAFLGTVNPLGVAFGQRIAPPKNMSIVSAVLMGWAWCLGSTAPSIVGELYQHLGHNASKTLAMLGAANVVMVMIGFLLPKVTDNTKNRKNGGEARLARRGAASIAGHGVDESRRRVLPADHGLDDTDLADGGRHLVEGHGVHVLAGLRRVGLELGHTLCAEIHKKRFGKVYHLNVPEERTAFHDAGGHSKTGCPQVCGIAARIAAELLLDKRTG